MKGKIIIVATLAILVALLLITRAARQARSDQLQNPYTGIASVTAVVTKLEPFARTISETGVLTGNKESMIAAQTGGQVTALFVDAGEFVKAGEPILKIDDELYGLEAERAKITYEKAKMDLDRVERLHTQNSASDSDLEGLRLMAKGAEVAYKMAEKTFRDATIKAPFSGVIAAKFTEVGQMVGPGTPVVQLIDQANLKLILQIPEESIRFIKIGANAPVVIDALGITIEGKVASIGSKAYGGSRTFPVEIRFRAEESVRPGMFARAEIESGEIQAIVLPRVALLPDAGRSVVFVARDNLAEKTVVKILGQSGDKVAVEGLNEGAIVVTTGNQLLTNGASLSVTMAKEIAE